MDKFEEQILDYLDYLRTLKSRSYLLYQRSVNEQPLYFHNGME